MEYHEHDLFISNHGKGPMMARILCFIDGNKVKMERWVDKNRNPQFKQFELPVSFLDSKTCGWVRFYPRS